jgi:carboxyl-terminal processing protease
MAMRGWLVLGGILLGAAHLPAAAPVHTDRPGAPPLSRQEAQAYAQQLGSVLNQVAASYVRPIPRSQLYLAALSGLYEEVGLAVPPSLPGDLEKTVKDPKVGDDEDFQAALEKLGNDDEIAALIATVRQRVGDHEGLRGQKALRVSLQAMTRLLDPYSALIDGEELARGNGIDVNRGFGLELASEQVAGPLRIKSVVLGGPAQRAGLRPGDQITHIAGQPVTEDNRYLLQGRLGRGVEIANLQGRKVELAVASAGGTSERRVTLEWQDFTPETVLGVHRQQDESWSYLLDRERKIGYVRIGPLENGTAMELHRALVRLKGDQMRGLIIDLRWCPGGYLNEAVLIARMFLDDGVVATVRNRGRKDDQLYRADDGSLYLGKFPIVVLVNAETMGGAELIAAALQDNKRAIIVGQRTFGKASVQTPMPLPLDHLGFKLTTGSFIRPSGKALHRFPDSRPSDDWGVRPEPDLELRVSPDLSKQLRDWWQLYSLRPSTSNEALPVDDPDNDPQRQLAVKAIRKLIKE